MKKFFKSLYLSERLFLCLAGFIVLFVLSYLREDLFVLLKYIFLFFILIIVTDIILIFRPKKGIEAERFLPEKFSNGDNNPVIFSLKNNYPFFIKVRLIDEIPIQFQIRNFLYKFSMPKAQEKTFKYDIKPTQRGVYSFGKMNLYVESELGLIRRRYVYAEGKDIAVYPSFLQLQKYDLKAFVTQLHEFGLKKIRRIGHTMEFEQIKEYSLGDDIRNINWKATAKRGNLMVNQFQDERAQPVYSVIDKGRVMKMPFNGLSLLDYAINASLVISNIALQKNDKAGVFTFSKKVENRVPPERRKSQMHSILETLYGIKTDYSESDFGRLYADVKRVVNQRSLLFLYTNFENMDSMQRQLPYLKSLAKNHLLVVIFFKNIEVQQLMNRESGKKTREIYQEVIAEKFNFEKTLIVNELKKHGIASILTEPENLTIQTINKYLELKSRGAI